MYLPVPVLFLNSNIKSNCATHRPLLVSYTTKPLVCTVILAAQYNYSRIDQQHKDQKWLLAYRQLFSGMCHLLDWYTDPSSVKLQRPAHAISKRHLKEAGRGGKKR